MLNKEMKHKMWTQLTFNGLVTDPYSWPASVSARQCLSWDWINENKPGSFF